MLIKTFAAALIGIDAELITCEIKSSPGVTMMMVGLPDLSVKESRERFQSAFEQIGLKVPRKKFVINLSPADIRKEGTHYDLPLAVGILAAAELIPAQQLERYLIVGELSLDGHINKIRGALPMAIKAKESGFKGIILPLENAPEAAIVSELEVYGMTNLKEVYEFFRGESISIPYSNDSSLLAWEDTGEELDFAEVKGQDDVKRAFEVAAAGGHNILLIGAPGSGKSMMAKRLPSILPPLTLQEALETTKIHSVAGYTSNKGLITVRPFRAPHHTISSAALVGGGINPMPGEFSLAHNGVLFLDELLEFPRNVLEVMRQPLEDRKICISRAKNTVTYPAALMLVASMNPCPCGYYNHPTKECSCSSGAVKKYLNRISGPLLDRIDIQMEIVPVPFNDLANNRSGESSKIIRERVIAARAIQTERFKNNPGIYCNAQMTPRLIHKYAQPDAEGLALIEQAMHVFSLSARAYDRILKLSRSIADLENAPNIQKNHISEAIHYRNLDKENWAG